MASINQKPQSIFTHEGAKAQHISPYLELRRSVMACLLWEDGFYESGQEIGNRIAELAHKVTAQQLSDIAVEARNDHHLRHVSLLLVRELARHKALPRGLASATIEKVINRADELSEFLAIYWQEGKCPLSKQVKQGLARAFQKFDEYQLAKWGGNA